MWLWLEAGLATLAVGLVLIWKRKNETQVRSQAEWAAFKANHQEWTLERSARLDAFVNDWATKLPLHTVVGSGPATRTVIGCPPASDGFVVATARYDDQGEFDEAHISITFADVASATATQTTVRELAYREEVVLQTNQAPRSVVGRAIAGGLLLGPLGAVVGGMSGIPTRQTQSLSRELVENGSKEVAVGPPRLELVLMDAACPTLSIDFKDMANAKAWAARIDSAAARVQT